MMENALAVLIPASAPAESPTPSAVGRVVREVTKEFVRRPAKGWTDSTPVPVVRFDHHCAIWEQS